MTASPLRTTVGGLAVAVVAAAVAYGLLEVGPPSDERERRLDERRIEDLRRMARAIDLHWTRTGDLPATLDLLADALPRDVTFNDPESGEPYQYRVLTDSRFELCGIFGTDWARPSEDEFWSHPVGRHCFDLEAHEVQRDDDEEEKERAPLSLPPRL